MDPPDTDAGAMERMALAGSTSAWDGLYRRHNVRIIGALLARGAPAALASDLAQEAWARLITLQQEGRLEYLQLPGLAVTTACNLLFDHYRRGSRLRTLGAADQGAGPDSPERDVVARETIDRVHAELDQASPRDHRIFWAVAVEGRSVRDVAAEHDLAEMTVRSMVYRLRERLRAIDTEAA